MTSTKIFKEAIKTITVTKKNIQRSKQKYSNKIFKEANKNFQIKYSKQTKIFE